MTRVVTAHQPNFAPGASVVTKIAASDVVIWLDQVQFTRRGWTNRQKLPDGRWLTIPVEPHCSRKPLHEVCIGSPEGGWREGFCASLREAWPGEVTEAVCAEVMRPYGKLVGLNIAVLDIVLRALDIATPQASQMHLAGGHALPIVSDDREDLKPISYRLAMMTAELGGDVYLSGPSGKNYLDETPFHKLGIEVDYWAHHGPNPCSLELAMLADRLGVAA